ncbi:MAG: aspartate kinase [Bdellovibrionales bacterium]
MGSLIVQKYGGMCLATPEKIKAVAAKVAERHKRGHSMMVIVSAMGKTTDELVKLAYQASPEPSRRELDMLLTTGERISMSLMSMALRDLGVEAISLTGSQAGVMTDSSHSNAKIIDVRPTRLSEELARGKVIVLAGFQGVDPTTKEITTLGRGGSDTTAVAMAAACKAEACEIIKEVDGLCSADPRIVPSAKVYPTITHDSLLDMCFWGAKILHYRSVELAHQMKVNLSLRFSDDHKRGTEVRSEVPMFENQKILAVNSHHEVHHFEVPGVGSSSDGLERFVAVLRAGQLPLPQILASAFDSGKFRAMYTSDGEHLAALKRAIEASGSVKVHRPPLSSITLTCHGSVATDLNLKLLQKLHAAGISVEKTLQSPLSITVLVTPDKREQTIQLLHQMI